VTPEGSPRRDGGQPLKRTPPPIGSRGPRAQAAVADTYRQLILFGAVFERVRADYVEKPDDSKLIESAINSMLAGLDPHSSYMDSKSFLDLQVQTRGHAMRFDLVLRWVVARRREGTQHADLIRSGNSSSQLTGDGLVAVQG
jgi:C-terminal processing protease CtpA/Prc